MASPLSVRAKIVRNKKPESNSTRALTSVAQLTGHQPTRQKIAGWIPSQGIHLGWGFVPGQGA